MDLVDVSTPLGAGLVLLALFVAVKAVKMVVKLAMVAVVAAGVYLIVAG